MAIRCPKNGGSVYYNYKGFHSIILLALVDAKYKFLWVDVGILDIPDSEPVPGDDHDKPYFVIGDDAFSRRTWLMKPFSARGLPDENIFNYRLSCARRVVGNGFGIMANRFGCLVTIMSHNPETVVTSIVVVCCTLHNIMRLRNPPRDSR